MTTDHACRYLRKYQLWRRGTDERTFEAAGLDTKQIGQALDHLLAEIPQLNKSLASTREQLRKCQIQREQFHSQLRSKRA